MRDEHFAARFARLSEAERFLRAHSPAEFDTSMFAFPECIEAVRLVEGTEAWRAAYASLDEFYVAHEGRHPDIRLYGKARREISEADPLTSPGGTATQRLERLRRSDP